MDTVSQSINNTIVQTIQTSMELTANAMMDTTRSITKDVRDAQPTTIGVDSHADHQGNASKDSSGTTQRDVVFINTQTAKTTNTGMVLTADATRDFSI